MKGTLLSALILHTPKATKSPVVEQKPETTLFRYICFPKPLLLRTRNHLHNLTCWLLLIIAVLAMNTHATAQSLLWATNTGGIDDDESLGLTVDAVGNVISTGYFYGNTDFDPGADAYILSSVGFCDIYIQKLDADGNFIWAVSLNGGEWEFDQGRSVVTDSTGNIYITGVFGGDVDFDPGVGVELRSAVDNEDVFILKLSPAGDLIWVQTFGSSAYDQGNSIDIDDNGNVLVTGSFWYTIDVDAGSDTVLIDNIGAQDAFILKLSGDGDLIFAKNFGGLSDDSGMSVHHDSNNNIIISGTFSKDADFNPDTGIYTMVSNGSLDLFILKLDPAGNFIWATAIGGNGMDFTRNVCVDVEGSVYVIGEFLTEAIAVTPDTSITFSSNGDYDMLIVKISGAGELKWGYAIGGELDDAATDVITDGFANVYITGYFRQSVDFDTGEDSVVITCPGVYDAFVLKLGGDGSFKDVMHIGGTKLTMANDICFDEQFNFYIGGLFDYTSDFDPDTSIYSLHATGSYDAFIAKYANCVTEVASSPVDQTALVGNDAIFVVQVIPEFCEVHWQKFQIDEFEDLMEGPDFIGVHNDTLIIAAVSIDESNTMYRCVIDAFSCSDTSDIATLYVEEDVVINNMQLQDVNLRVYPNPAEGILNIENMSGPLVIFNAFGQEMITFDSGSTQIDISLWPSGFYFAVIRGQLLNGNSCFVKK